MLVYMQDTRMGSEIATERGREADGLHAGIASLGALGFPSYIFFSNEVLYAVM